MGRLAVYCGVQVESQALLTTTNLTILWDSEETAEQAINKTKDSIFRRKNPFVMSVSSPPSEPRSSPLLPPEPKSSSPPPPEPESSRPPLPEPESMVKSIEYFAFDIPHDMPEAEKKQASAMIAAHIVHLQNSQTTTTEDGDPPAKTIITYIFTVMALLFPDVAEEALSANIPLVKRSASLNVKAFLDDLLAYDKQVEDEAESETIVDGEGESDMIDYVLQLPSSLRDLDFGVGRMEAKVTYSDAAVEILASRWAVEMLFTGGYVSEVDSLLFPRALVKALKRVLRLDERQAKYFNGDLAPTLAVLRGVMWALDEYHPARQFVSLMCYEYREEPLNTTELSFGITRNLSHGHGLPSAALTLEALVDDLLTAYPAIVENRDLTSQIIDYREERFAYWKLAKSERTYIDSFNRAEYKLRPLTPRWALVAVAAAYRQQYDPAVGEFIELGPYSSVIAGVNRCLSMMGREVITGAGSRMAFDPVGVNTYVRPSGRTLGGSGEAAHTWPSYAVGAQPVINYILERVPCLKLTSPWPHLTQASSHLSLNLKASSTRERTT
ncbi:hypothetical protein L249_0369 [Ophiocordyceps polyrhachis-furcata BCC 54312]|uniref:Uncharacterized protein n=1 Tax=Ophiocordyceps polyrhachis-furcata BCC 54312 TaxID=1330021 RepID=A0A367LFJ3_9HYPO|nr:hypothetical protein L249_0369 [Ophiocordyceps polyrhachis-furcata BCC 54312]